MYFININLKSVGLLSPPTPSRVCREMLSKKQWKIIKSLNKDIIVASKTLTKQILLEFLNGNDVTRAKIGNSKYIFFVYFIIVIIIFQIINNQLLFF
jgi:hypothetical protein